MARTRVKSRAAGGGFALDVEVDGFDRTAREFKEVRRRIARDLRDVEARAAEETVLPVAKVTATRFKVEGESLSGHVVVRKSAAGPYLTTNFRGMRARAAGLLERGGTVKTPILPKRGKALVINGQPVASVRTARHYRAHRYLQSAVDERLGSFGDRVRDGIVDFFSEVH